nr:uncharacterized protein LOC129276321 [Lytechinus pictus]
MMSLLTTLAIAVERFIIFYLDPFGNRKIITPFRTVLAFSVTWVFVGGLFYIMGSRLKERLYLLGKVILSSTILIITMVTVSLYKIIYQKITSASTSLGASETFLQRRFKMHQKIIVTFSLVVGTTGLCWLPVTVTEFLKGFPQVNDKAWYIVLERVFFGILCSNQFLNPIIVWSRLTEFRDTLKVCRRGDQAGSGSKSKSTGQKIRSVSANVPVNNMSRDNPNFIASP